MICSDLVLEELLQKEKSRYNKCSFKEKAAKYYSKNIEVFFKKKGQISIEIFHWKKKKQKESMEK